MIVHNVVTGSGRATTTRDTSREGKNVTQQPLEQHYVQAGDEPMMSYIEKWDWLLKD